jgi:hypothetical protein
MTTATTRTLPIAYDLECERGEEARIVIDPPADTVFTAATASAFFFRQGGTAIPGSTVTATIVGGTVTVVWPGTATTAIAEEADQAERTRIYYRIVGTVDGVANTRIASGFLTIYEVGDERRPIEEFVVNPTEGGTSSGGGVTAGDLATAVAALAPTDSPAFTGTPTAPTPTAGDNDTSIATTAFVTAAVAAGGGASLASPAFRAAYQRSRTAWLIVSPCRSGALSARRG